MYLREVSNNHRLRMANRWPALLVCIALMAGCTSATVPTPSATPAPGEITAVEVWLRAAPAGSNSAAYMTLLNGTGEDVQLVEVAAPVTEDVTLHETVNENNVLRMVPQPDGFAVAANGATVLEPGGKHAMLVGVAHSLDLGDTVELTLRFSNGLELAVTGDVREMGGQADEHEGH
jgi:periplasmic copper chaperone A